MLHKFTYAGTIQVSKDLMIETEVYDTNDIQYESTSSIMAQP